VGRAPRAAVGPLVGRGRVHRMRDIYVELNMGPRQNIHFDRLFVLSKNFA
jgi:hypothetical protein